MNSRLLAGLKRIDESSDSKKGTGPSSKMNWKNTFASKIAGDASFRSNSDKMDVTIGASEKSDILGQKNVQTSDEASNNNITRDKTLTNANNISRPDETNEDSSQKQDTLGSSNIQNNTSGPNRVRQNLNTSSTLLKGNDTQSQKGRSVPKANSKEAVEDSLVIEKQRSRSGSNTELNTPTKTVVAPTKKPLKPGASSSNNSSPGVPKMADIVRQAMAQAKGQQVAQRLTLGSRISSSPSAQDTPPLKPAGGVSTAASVAFARDFMSNKAKTSNVKVVARIRPMNKMESELKASGVGSECVIFPSENSCAIMPENQVFTLDRIFKPDCRQTEIYDFIGKETIEDVLNGFNGTVFAYGQTGSGKTFTMYGVMHDPELKGLIPRSSEHIFEYINSMEEDVDISIKCSMLEIYKENLYDLLAGDKMVSDKVAQELKIKENPRRGIFIEGLTEEDVGSPEELMELLEIGEKQRTVASTRMNNYSSRSHSIFIMEIIQKFTNEAEKRGRLNLVDLAGSEKVGKTGATGETLEEAKKINLSLSCLGFVIHALTSGYEHIPYRDSKLTRILQESLGGNYKTTLIVAASPYSSNKEETITTLKFASRAKTIKNQVKMNIQNSPEALMAVIEGLKLELDECRTELSRFKESGGIPNVLGIAGTPDSQRNFSRFKANGKDAISHFMLDDNEKPNYEAVKQNFQLDLFDPKANMEKIRQEYALNKTETELQEVHNKGLSKIIQNSLGFFKGTVAKELISEIEEATNQYHKKDYNSYAYYKTNLELLAINEGLANRVVKLSKERENVYKEMSERDTKIREQEEEIMLMKNQLLDIEKKNSILTQQNALYELKLKTKTDNLEIQRVTIEVLEKQINAISEALGNGDQEVERLLSEKSRIVNAKFLEFMQDDLKFKEIKLPDYFKHSFNFNFEPFFDQAPAMTFLNPNYNANDNMSPDRGSQVDEALATNSDTDEKGEEKVSMLEDDKIPDEKASLAEKHSKGERGSLQEKTSSQNMKKGSGHGRDSFISGIDLEYAFNNAEHNLREVIEIPYAVQAALNKLANGSVLRDALGEQNSMSAEFVIYILKQQLLQAFIINQHLERTISVLEWKQVIEYGKAKIKSYYTKMQERHILNLEKVLDKARISHEQLRKRVEDVELETIRLRESVLNVGPTAFDVLKPQAQKSGARARILRNIKHDQRRAPRWSSLKDQQASNSPTPHGQAGPQSIFSEISLKVEIPSKNTLTQKEGEKPGSQRLQSETDLHEQSDEKNLKDQRNANSASGPAGRNALGTQDPAAFIKEIESELKSASNDPNTLEEAKQLLAFKNTVIIRMKGYIANFSHAGNNNNTGLQEIHQNLIEYLKYDNDRLENKNLVLQTELGVEKTRSEQIKEAFNEQKKQMEKLNDLNRELEIAARNAIKKENESWQKIHNEVKTTHVQEMMRKQEEVNKLHDFLAGWVFRYMELQESQNIIPTHVEKMLYEVFKRREFPPKQLLEKALFSTKNISVKVQQTPPKANNAAARTRPRSYGGGQSDKLYVSLNLSMSDAKRAPIRDFLSPKK